MMSRRCVLCGLLFLLAAPGFATPDAPHRYTEEGRDRWRNPLDMREMGPWAEISFDAAGFKKIERGMTEEQVLQTLGRPDRLEKQRRPGHRWTVQYHYSKGHVVHFRDGLVVGKERVQP